MYREDRAARLRRVRKPKKANKTYVVLAILCIASLSVVSFFLFDLVRVYNRSAEVRRQLDSVAAENTDSIDEPLADLEIPENLEQNPQSPTEPEVIISPEILALREQFGNDDIVGRLSIIGTSIDYPVVQGVDNEFYLRHDIRGNPSSGGWIFLDYEVDIAGHDQNIVIYGHNMMIGTMFHSLRHYVDYDFLREHQIISFSTLYADYEWEIFAFFRTHIDFPYTHINFPNVATWGAMLEQFMQHSMHDTGIIVTPDDRILTLSTCTNQDPDERFVLQARLIR